MPRAHQLWLGAYRRYGGREDPLTELLATALEAYPPFAAALFAHKCVCLPPPERVEVSTQVRTYDGEQRRLVDLEVLGLDAAGSLVGRLWSENKVGARYQPDQLASYKRSLASMPGEWRLITIVDSEEQAEPHASAADVHVMTWRVIAELAWRAGREQEQDLLWRRRALEPERSAGIRLLEELISYLEEEHNVTLDPVRLEHVRAFQLANETAERIEELLQGATTHASGLTADGGVDYDVKNDWGSYWQLFEGAPVWVVEAGGYLEMLCADDDGWTADGIDEPAIGAGATIPGNKPFDDLRTVDRSAWRDQLEAQEFELGVTGDFTRIFRTVYLAEVTTKGATIDAQSRWLAEWLEETMKRFATIQAPRTAR